MQLHRAVLSTSAFHVHRRNEFSRFLQFIQQIRLELLLCAPGTMWANYRCRGSGCLWPAQGFRGQQNWDSLVRTESWERAQTGQQCVSYSGKHSVHNFLISMFSAFFKNLSLNRGKPCEKSGLYTCDLSEPQNQPLQMERNHACL